MTKNALIFSVVVCILFFLNTFTNICGVAAQPTKTSEATSKYCKKNYNFTNMKNFLISNYSRVIINYNIFEKFSTTSQQTSDS